MSAAPCAQNGLYKFTHPDTIKYSFKWLICIRYGLSSGRQKRTDIIWPKQVVQIHRQRSKMGMFSANGMVKVSLSPVDTGEWSCKDRRTWGHELPGGTANVPWARTSYVCQEDERGITRAWRESTRTRLLVLYGVNSGLIPSTPHNILGLNSCDPSAQN